MHYGDRGQNFRTGSTRMRDLGLEEGSTLLCLAPGEEVPEEAGWETVGSADFRGYRVMEPQVLRWGIGNDHNTMTYPATIRKGDAYRVQVRRAKPKTAVRLRHHVNPGNVHPGGYDGWQCSECNLPHAAFVLDCPNCWTHFTETKEL